MDHGQPAQGDDERDRVEEVAVAVLQPAAAVVEQRRDEDRERRAGQPPASWADASRPGRRTAARGSSAARTCRGRPAEERAVADRLRQVDEEVVEVHRDVDDREQALLRAAPPGRPAAWPARSRDSSGVPKRSWLYAKKATTSRRDAERRTTIHVRHGIASRGPGDVHRPRRPRRRQRPVRVRAAGRRTGRRTPAAHGSGTPHRRAGRPARPAARPHSSTRQANVRIVATRWPVCHTPPRVVTHRICVEKPNRIVSHSRSTRRWTPRSRPSSHQHRPTPPAAEHGVDPGFDLVGARGAQRSRRAASARRPGTARTARRTGRRPG